MRVVLDVDIFSEGTPHREALMRIGRWFTLACLALGVLASAFVDVLAGAWPASFGQAAWLVGVVVVLSAAALPVHELVHAAAFKLLGPAGTKVTFGHAAGMLYAGCPGVRLARGRFCAVLLAPVVVLTCAFCALGALVPLGWAPLAAVWLVVFHAAGCVGDLYFAWLIVRTPGVACVEDTECGIRLLGRQA